MKSHLRSIASRKDSEDRYVFEFSVFMADRTAFVQNLAAQAQLEARNCDFRLSSHIVCACGQVSSQERWHHDYIRNHNGGGVKRNRVGSRS